MLSDAEAHSVFYDLAFYQDRNSATSPTPDSLNAFANTIRGVVQPTQMTSDCRRPEHAGARKGMPVFLAAIRNAPILPALCDAGAEGVWVDWPDEGNLYPLALREKDTAAKGMPVALYLTAARRLYEDACTSPIRIAGIRCDLASDDDDRSAPNLSLAWPVGLHPLQGAFGSIEQCNEPKASGVFEKITASLSSFFHDLVGQGAAVMHKCSYPLLLPIDWLLYPASTPALLEALRNKIVIVGTDLPALNDVVWSPVNGTVAGAYAHATALDNLFRFGRHYFYDVSQSGTKLFALRLGGFCIIVLFVFATMLAIEWLRRRPPNLDILAYDKRGPGARLIADAVIDLMQLACTILAVLVGLLIVALFVFFALRIAPINWLGMTLLIVGLASDEIFPATIQALAVLLMSLPPARWIARAFFPRPSMEQNDA